MSQKAPTSAAEVTTAAAAFKGRVAYLKVVEASKSFKEEGHISLQCPSPPRNYPFRFKVIGKREL